MGDRAENVRYLSTTGILRIHLGDQWSKAAVSDEKDAPLESTLNQIFIRIYALVVKDREDQRRREHESRQRAESERRRAEVEAIRREEVAQLGRRLARRARTAERHCPH